MKTHQFKSLYHKVICETTDISSEQIVIDMIEDEFIPEGFNLKDNWKMEVSPMVEYIENNMPEDKTILTIDYNDLLKLVNDAMLECNVIDSTNESNKDFEDINSEEHFNTMKHKGTECFDSFKSFAEYCKNRYNDRAAEVLDDYEMWQITPDNRVQFAQTTADLKYLPKDEIDELYYKPGETWDDPAIQTKHEIWSTVNP